MIPVIIGAPSGSDFAAALMENPTAINSVRSPIRGRVHRLLRAATRIDHANLDRMMLRIDLGTPSDYAFFLQVHEVVLRASQPYWRVEDAEDFYGMLRALEKDSQQLGSLTSPVPSIVHTPMLLSYQWGIAYVLRGSRLGAQFLRRRVSSELPTAYLDFTPALTWPRFLEQLELMPEASGGTHCDDSIRGARVAFGTFSDVFTQAIAGRP